MQIYAKVFDLLKLTDKNIRILEIGAGDTGASHKMWAEYFPKADVFCIDPFHLGAQNKNLKEELKLFGVNVFQGNQLSRDDLRSFIKLYGADFDVIIDDAAHMPDAIQISLGCLFPCLKNNGVYFVEDLVCATDRQNRIQQVNEVIDGVLGIPHVVDYTLYESFKGYSEDNEWRSNTLSDKEKQYLVKNIFQWRFFHDTDGPNNLCMIKKK